jgi:hypothetical protein
MGSIKLQIDQSIVNTINEIVSKSAEINTSTFNKIMTLIAWCVTQQRQNMKGIKDQE